jgi:hypothetical protein
MHLQTPHLPVLQLNGIETADFSAASSIDSPIITWNDLPEVNVTVGIFDY